jgi:hypothetical protein
VGREQGGGRGEGHTTNVVLDYLMGEEELHCDCVSRSSFFAKSRFFLISGLAVTENLHPVGPASLSWLDRDGSSKS